MCFKHDNVARCMPDIDPETLHILNEMALSGKRDGFEGWFVSRFGTIALEKDVKFGKSFQLGIGCIIEPDVIVGDNVTLGHNVILKSGTRIGNDVVLGDNVCTTGVCKIGNHVRIRTGSVISKGVIIDDWAFIGAGIMTSHTKNVSHGRPQMEPRQLLTRIGYGAIVGSRCNLMAGVWISPGVIVGYDSNVVGDLAPVTNIPVAPMPTTAESIHYISPTSRYIAIGNPAKFFAFQHPSWYIDIPNDYVPYSIDAELLAKYLPHYQITQDQFEEWYAAKSNVSIEWLHTEKGRARRCDCGEDNCIGWSMSQVEGA